MTTGGSKRASSTRAKPKLRAKRAGAATPSIAIKRVYEEASPGDGMRILVDRLGKDVALEPRPIDPKLLKEAKRALHLSASDIKRARRPSKRKVNLKRNVLEN